ncbi:SGNH/GDSL hydrolase family protein [Streptomyces sp. NBC_01264]|nr:SGNH/GDSL hydrolase family protein [Streptomyces sp. NBC_01264]MCX4782710.1 SGNH/GDSL hydrolase family protein [Streptomyces sp. NBC_01264]
MAATTTSKTKTIGSYAALGDSFTEGVGDPGPGDTFLGWADRLAVLLADRCEERYEHSGASSDSGASRASGDPGSSGGPGEPAGSAGPAGSGAFRYANLAVRGRLLDQIVAEQVPRAMELAPDLVTFCAGGNDIIRPGSDPDDVAERYEAAVRDLTGSVGLVVITTGFDTRDVPVLKHMRGKIATFSAHVRSIADRYECPVLDLWSLKSIQDRRAWDDDRLHLSPEGHTRVALRAAQVLGLDTPADPDQPWPPMRPRGSVDTTRDNIHWAREHLVPWIGRRLRGESSGDHVEPKRPDLLPL